jgi:hypothetical protein
MPAKSTGARWPAAAAGLLLVLYVGLALSAARRESPTFDESLHLTAGYLHWTHPEEKLWPENGVFAQGWAALPLLFDHLNADPGKATLPRDMEQWGQGYRFFYLMGNDPEQMLRQGRAMITLLGAAVGFLVFRWSRELFGPAGALLSLVLFVFCPTMLANGALVTADMASSLGFLAATYAFWRLTHRVSAGSVAFSLLALGCLVLSKMSSILIVPIFLLLLLVRLCSDRPVELAFGAPRRIEARRRRASLWVLLLLGHALAMIALLWLAYDFSFQDWGQKAIRLKAHAAPGFSPWSGHGLKLRALEGLDRSGLLPRSYVEGLSYTLDAINRGGFVLGSFSEQGRWWFFPVSFLIKTPISTLALLALALAAGLDRSWNPGGRSPATGANFRVPLLYEIAPLLVLGGVFGAACLSSNINIGHRHMMPLYPVLFILAGANVLWLRFSGPFVRIALGALLAGVVVESSAVRPDYLAFFNRFVGGPSRGYRYLVDSSVDWGQGLPALRHWLDRNAPAGAAPVYLSYFGTADPEAYGIKALRLPDRFGSVPGRPFPLQGGVYCISATILQAAVWTREEEDTYWKVRREIVRFSATAADPGARRALIWEQGANYWNYCFETFSQLRFLRLCVYLQPRPPDDEAAYSILIYRLSDAVVEEVLNASPAPPALAPRPAGG